MDQYGWRGAGMLGGLALAALVCGCSSTPAAAPPPQAPAPVHPSRFVEEPEPVFVETPQGLVRINTDGTGRRRLAGPGMSIAAMSLDGELLAVRDDERDNLYVLRGQGKPRRVRELDMVLGAAALSPDESVLAAVRSPALGALTDDRVYLVDIDTLKVQVVPKATERYVVWLTWSTDGRHLWIQLKDGAIQRVDIETRTRQFMTRAPPKSELFWTDARPSRCRSALLEVQPLPFLGDLKLTHPVHGTRLLLTAHGREPGTKANGAYFTRTCRQVVYALDDAVWVVDVPSGTTGKLIEGRRPRGLPRRQEPEPRELEPDAGKELVGTADKWQDDSVLEDKEEAAAEARLALPTDRRPKGYEGLVYAPRLTLTQRPDRESELTWAHVGLASEKIHYGRASGRARIDAQIGGGEAGADGRLHLLLVP